MQSDRKIGNIDPMVLDILQRYHPKPREAVWNCHGTWVAYHRALEIVAANAGIRFDQPVVILADAKERAAAICVTGHFGDRSEWSIGEAAPHNNKNAYEWAMAEKRAKDRVILKLLGLHGMVYSEAEADDFKPPVSGRADNDDVRRGNITRAKSAYRDLVADIKSCSDEEELDVLLGADRTKKLVARLWEVVPEWMSGGGDFPSFDEIVAEARRRLTE